jgi:Zinc carboxypeptidase
MKKILFFSYLFLAKFAIGQLPLTIFEESKGKESATYAQSIAYYQHLALKYKTIQIKTMGPTDAGFPLHIVLFSSDKQFNSANWKKNNKLVFLVTNGIHPGEPDGIDASMMLVRDLANGKIKAPNNIVLAVIPVYNIGGALNRNNFSRVNQDGPLAYGFRGNSQNLDLNRDFIKSDTKEALSFAKIFHWLNPDIYLDNHVSDGADYQYTMTLLTTQHNKLGGEIGKYLHNSFEPSLFKGMAQKGMAMTPYVSFEEGNPEKGWSYFYDPPRYSSGYAAVFQAMSFMSETHMLKPFSQRVIQTYELMQTMIEQASLQATAIKDAKQSSIEAIKKQENFAVSYQVDTTHFDLIDFKGYQALKKPSMVSGMERLYYDRTKPFTQKVKFYNYALESKTIQKPKAYIIPQGWQKVIELLEANSVQMKRLEKDTLIKVDAYHIDDYKTSTRVFEKHYRHTDLKTSTQSVTIAFRKGDYWVQTGQAADLFLVETLEPSSDDSYFSWNFFDAILQQKEGYSNYRWEDVAASVLASNQALQKQLEEKKKADPKFAASANAQLDFVYKNSPYYEPAHLRYPIYRLN